MEAIRAGLEDLGDAIALRHSDSPPIVGAALLALDDVGAAPAAQERARRELAAAVESELETMIHG
jgi:hypothetical protein